MRKIRTVLRKEFGGRAKTPNLWWNKEAMESLSNAVSLIVGRGLYCCGVVTEWLR